MTNNTQITYKCEGGAPEPHNPTREPGNWKDDESTKRKPIPKPDEGGAPEPR